MPKQKIQDKGQAILEAAIAVFAARGFWNTPTSLISKTAGIADGTLFTYFKTKDDLINEVYLELKREMAGQMLEGLPTEAAVHDKMRHIWNRYIDWGVQHPDKFKVLQQITESFDLADEVKSQGMEAFMEIQQMASESIANGEFRDYPEVYLGALVDSQATMTIRLITKNPEQHAEYKKIGFDILWNGITR